MPLLTAGMTSYLTLWSPLSSLKLARMAALSFWTTARSSAMVFEARTLRMNCFTTNYQSRRLEEGYFEPLQELIVAVWGPAMGQLFGSYQTKVSIWQIGRRWRLDLESCRVLC